MGQTEVLEFLSKQEKPLSRGQISSGLEEYEIKISHLLKKLIYQKEIKYVEVSRHEAKKLLGDVSPMRRCKLYYL